MPRIVRLGRPGRLQWSLAVLKFTSGWPKTRSDREQSGIAFV